MRLRRNSVALAPHSEGFPVPDIWGTDVAVATLPNWGTDERKGRSRGVFARAGLGLVLLALTVASASFAVLTGLTSIEPEGAVVPGIMLVNGAFVAVLCWMVGRELLSLFSARRREQAASRLHIRLVSLFSLVAVLPALLVAGLATLTLNQGLDRWFELRTTQIVDSSIEVAEAYVEENARNLQGQTLSMAAAIDSATSLYRLDRTGFQRLLDAQARGRGLVGASLLERSGQPRFTANTGRENPRPLPPLDTLSDADTGRPILISPGDTDLVGAVLKVENLDLYLYTVRLIDPRVMEAQRLVRENSDEYYALQSGQTQFKIAFALLYLGVTLIVLLAAIWAGLGIADRLVKPIGQLITAAGNVSRGHLHATVDSSAADGDLRDLADTFNGMTVQLRQQRDELIDAQEKIDERRRFSEAVLSGVSSGVLGIGRDGTITIANQAAEALLATREGTALSGSRIADILPESEDLFAAARAAPGKTIPAQFKVKRAGRERTFSAQLKADGEDASSFVLTLDDISELVAAQRSTAWSDVARRIAHEIKNPLTPIQLSAERLNRRYGRKLTTDREVFDQCTGTIVRHVEDIKRMVDEFSSFARMPKPTKSRADLRKIVSEAAFLIQMSRNDIEFDIALGDEPVHGEFDERLLGQAIGNVVKNATEAIDAVPDRKGHVAVVGRTVGNHAVLDVIDNGKGLPKVDRHKLLEPYMTTREKGTGLGLAIVKKIIEDHGGTLELHDAPEAFEGGVGAMLRFWLPLVPETDGEDADTPIRDGDEPTDMTATDTQNAPDAHSSRVREEAHDGV